MINSIPIQDTYKKSKNSISEVIDFLNINLWSNI